MSLNTVPLKPIFKEVFADLETPLTAYLKVAGHPSFLLESVEQGERIARYSFIGTGERKRIEVKGQSITVTTTDGIKVLETDDPLQVLWDETVCESYQDPKLPSFWAGAVGYASYDLIRWYETLPDNNPDELNIPDLLFIQPEALIIFDHLKRTLFIVSAAEVENDSDETRAKAVVERIYQRLRGPLPGVPGDRAGHKTEFKSNFTKEQYMQAVTKAVEYIHAGDAFQLVPGQRLTDRARRPPFCYLSCS